MQILAVEAGLHTCRQPIRVFTDAKNLLALVQKRRNLESAHLQADLAGLRLMLRFGLVELVHLAGASNISDHLTKQLSKEKEAELFHILRTGYVPCSK